MRLVSFAIEFLRLEARLPRKHHVSSWKEIGAHGRIGVAAADSSFLSICSGIAKHCLPYRIFYVGQPKLLRWQRSRVRTVRLRRENPPAMGRQRNLRHPSLSADR